MLGVCAGGAWRLQAAAPRVLVSKVLYYAGDLASLRKRSCTSTAGVLQRKRIDTWLQRLREHGRQALVPRHSGNAETHSSNVAVQLSALIRIEPGRGCRTVPARWSTSTVWGFRDRATHVSRQAAFPTEGQHLHALQQLITFTVL